MNDVKQKNMNTRLIVLRGPSGSGKSSIAKAVRLKCLETNKKTAYIEQDYFRRIVLKEKDIPNGFNIQFIKETVKFFLNNQYDVIMEGIFDQGRYEKMFEDLIETHSVNNFFFYFDISLAETLHRHNMKPNKNDFGEKELKEWYKDKDLLKCISEEIIPESNSFEDTVNFIYQFIQSPSVI